MIAEPIAAYHEGWPGPWVEDEIVGGHDPQLVAGALTSFCLDALAAAPIELVFYEVSVGCVAGLVLADGRRVVVKAHRPNVPAEYLAGATRVQAELARRGFPCPRPLAGPLPFGLGLATVETLVADGDRRDAHDAFIGEVRVVYDWDIVALDDEAVLVGNAAWSFPATWYLDAALAASPAATSFPAGGFRDTLARHGEEYLRL